MTPSYNILELTISWNRKQMSGCWGSGMGRLQEVGGRGYERTKGGLLWWPVNLYLDKVLEMSTDTWPSCTALR